jgi:hypothetical protein
VKATQPPASHSVRDRVPSQPRRPELGGCDDAVAARGERHHGAITGISQHS